MINIGGALGVIELENVAYSYGGGELFSEVTLTLEPGSFHFLTGPSGVGKTTLLRLCYGDLKPTAGVVNLFSRDVRSYGRDDMALVRRRIGIVHQNCEYLDHLTIEENIALPHTVAGKQSSLGSDLEDLIAWVGLKHQKAQTPPELSGGERQRAAVARAVIMSPDVVIADEPTGNIDWEMSQRVMGLLTELNRMGKTILIATHDMNLIRAVKSQVGARVLRLKDRRLMQAGAEL